jgi:hypothetical protein
VLEEAVSRRQKCHPARCAGEKGGAKLVFERADLAAERRLRDVKALGGATDVSFLRDGNEVADLREAHGRSMSCTLGGGKSAARSKLPLRRSKRYWTSPTCSRHGGLL